MDDRRPVRVWTEDLPYLDPFHACAAFSDEFITVLLDSTGPMTEASRHSYLAVDPFRIVTGHGALARIDGRLTPGSPLDVLAAELAQARIEPDPQSSPFRGGAAGYIGYECGAMLDGIAVAAPAPDDPPDLFVGFFDLVIGFDREHRTCRAHATGLPLTGDEPRARRAEARLAWLRARLGEAAPRLYAHLPALAFRSDWTRHDYGERMRCLTGYIAAGDIFQANLTLRHTAPRPAGLRSAAVHAALRARNPAPFGAWLRWGTDALCCTSPERFVAVSADGHIDTRPIKGTIAREADAAADAAAREQLLNSAKDRAENVMIVDVLRHDLGRVAAVGSVSVPALCALESYATLHHLVSRIRARLRPDATASDLLRAALPGGSITGAPKIRAMQIIAELEASRRGIYCGSVVWLGYDGAMDSNIVIRSVVLTQARLIVGAGGGIVADSEPDAEYDEMMLKAAPMLGIFGA